MTKRNSSGTRKMWATLDGGPAPEDKHEKHHGNRRAMVARLKPIASREERHAANREVQKMLKDEE